MAQAKIYWYGAADIQFNCSAEMVQDGYRIGVVASAVTGLFQPWDLETATAIGYREALRYCQQAALRAFIDGKKQMTINVRIKLRDTPEYRALIRSLPKSI